MGVKGTAGTVHEHDEDLAASTPINILGHTVRPTNNSYDNCTPPTSCQKKKARDVGTGDHSAFVVDDGYERRAEQVYRDRKRKRESDDEEDDVNETELRSELRDLQLDANIWNRYEYIKRARAGGAQWVLEPVDPKAPVFQDTKPENSANGRPKRQRKERVKLEPEWTYVDFDASDGSEDRIQESHVKKAPKSVRVGSSRKGVHRTAVQKRPTTAPKGQARISHNADQSRQSKKLNGTSVQTSKPTTTLKVPDETPLKQFKKHEPAPKPKEDMHCTIDESSEEDLYDTAPEYQLHPLPTPPSMTPPPRNHIPPPADISQRLLDETIILRDLAARKLYTHLHTFAKAWDNVNSFITSSGPSSTSCQVEKAALIKTLETETGQALELLRGRATANLDLIDESQHLAFWGVLSDPTPEPVDRNLLLTFGSMDVGDLMMLLGESAEDG